MTEPVTEPQSGPVRPRRRQVRRLLTAVVALLVAVAAALWWGRPQLGDGGLYGPGAGTTVADDGFETTRFVVRSGDTDSANATFSIRNDGRLPVTVVGLDLDEYPRWLQEQRVTFLPDLPTEQPDPPPTERITLGPGDIARVNWSLDMRCRPAQEETGHTVMELLRLRVRTVGIPATLDWPLPLPLTIVGDPSPGVDADECLRELP